MNTRDTLEVHLNVFGTFDPVLPDSFRDSTHVFLANGSPVVQAKVLDQVRRSPSWSWPTRWTCGSKRSTTNCWRCCRAWTACCSTTARPAC